MTCINISTLESLAHWPDLLKLAKYTKKWNCHHESSLARSPESIVRIANLHQTVMEHGCRILTLGEPLLICDGKDYRPG